MLLVSPSVDTPCIAFEAEPASVVAKFKVVPRGDEKITLSVIPRPEADSIVRVETAEDDAAVSTSAPEVAVDIVSVSRAWAVENSLAMEVTPCRCIVVDDGSACVSGKLEVPGPAPPRKISKVVFTGRPVVRERYGEALVSACTKTTSPGRSTSSTALQAIHHDHHCNGHSRCTTNGIVVLTAQRSQSRLDGLTLSRPGPARAASLTLPYWDFSTPWMRRPFVDNTGRNKTSEKKKMGLFPQVNKSCKDI